MSFLSDLSDFWWHIRLPRAHRSRIRAARLALDRLRPIACQNTPDAARELFYELRRLDPLVFEEFVLQCLADGGCRIRRNRRYSGDGGIDGRVFHRGRWCPVQCKRYGDSINPRHVQDFTVILNRHRAPAGWFIHTGRTGPLSAALAAESGNRVRFISGDKLRRLVAGEFNNRESQHA